MKSCIHANWVQVIFLNNILGSNISLPVTEITRNIENVFSVTFDIKSINIGEMILEFKVWDKYHINSTSSSIVIIQTVSMPIF